MNEKELAQGRLIRGCRMWGEEQVWNSVTEVLPDSELYESKQFRKIPSPCKKLVFPINSFTFSIIKVHVFYLNMNITMNELLEWLFILIILMLNSTYKFYILLDDNSPRESRIQNENSE